MTFSVQELYKHFGEKRVLEGVSFDTESGKAFGLLGRNGAGKTTTIRIVMGVFPADSGSVLLDGAPIRHDKLQIGYLPEERGLYPKVIIREQLLYLAALRGVPHKTAKVSIKYWLGRLGMEETYRKKLDTLSKGNQQKIQLAAALVADPEIIILDEPFSGLDPVNASLLKDVVKELIQKGKLVLFSSHQMNYVEEFCDSIAILHQGKIALSGSIEGIKRSYDRRVIDLRSGDIEAAQKFCQEKLYDLVEGSSVKDAVLHMQLREEGGKSRLIQQLAGQGFDIDSISVHEPTLNDIFVQTAGDAPATEGGQAE